MLKNNHSQSKLRKYLQSTCGLDDVFPPDDLGSGPCTPFITYMPYIIAAIQVIKKANAKRHTHQKWPCWCVRLYDTAIISCLDSNVYFNCIVQHSLYHNMGIATMWRCALVSSTPSQSICLSFGCALFWCWVPLGSPAPLSHVEVFFIMILIMIVDFCWDFYDHSFLFEHIFDLHIWWTVV